MLLPTPAVEEQLLKLKLKPLPEIAEELQLLKRKQLLKEVVAEAEEPRSRSCPEVVAEVC
jgi:hypothetical protein